MNFEEAWMRVGMAGRELGSGPAVAAERLTDFNEGVKWLTERGVTEERAGTIMLGTAVGLVMAEDQVALETLADITTEWERSHANG